MVHVGVNVYFSGKRVNLLSKNLKGSEILKMFCSHWYEGQGTPAFLIMAKRTLKGHHVKWTSGNLWPDILPGPWVLISPQLADSTLPVMFQRQVPRPSQVPRTSSRQSPYPAPVLWVSTPGDSPFIKSYSGRKPMNPTDGRARADVQTRQGGA